MKVRIGDSVKNIPKKYECGISIVREDQLDSPYTIRLTPFERFLLAEASWRVTLNNKHSFTKDYLDGFVPKFASMQINRSRDKRFVVRYTEHKGVNAMALVPKSVWRVCPNELKKKEYFNF